MSDSNARRCLAWNPAHDDQCQLQRVHPDRDHMGLAGPWPRSRRGRKPGTVRTLTPAEWIPEAQFLMEQGCTPEEMEAALGRKVATISRAARRLDERTYARLIAMMETEMAIRKRKTQSDWAA